MAELKQKSKFSNSVIVTSASDYKQYLLRVHNSPRAVLRVLYVLPHLLITDTEGSSG